MAPTCGGPLYVQAVGFMADTRGTAPDPEVFETKRNTTSFCGFHLEEVFTS